MQLTSLVNALTLRPTAYGPAGNSFNNSFVGVANNAFQAFGLNQAGRHLQPCFADVRCSVAGTVTIRSSSGQIFGIVTVAANTYVHMDFGPLGAFVDTPNVDVGVLQTTGGVATIDVVFNYNIG